MGSISKQFPAHIIGIHGDIHRYQYNEYLLISSSFDSMQTRVV